MSAIYVGESEQEWEPVFEPVPGVGNEFEGSCLGDKRLDCRVKALASHIATAPGESFPKLFKDGSELEAFYRFVENPYFDMQTVLQPHYQHTAERCSSRREILVVHDTTEFSFSGEVPRRDLGRLRHGGQGFFGHFSLAVSADLLREPLGVVNVLPWTRARQEGEQSSQWPFVTKEQERWVMAVDASESRLKDAGDVNAIHVMDREGDSYEIFARVKRFVIRVCHDRQVQWFSALGEDVQGKLFEGLRQCQAQCVREVRLSQRAKGKTPSQRKHYPARRGRQATLHMSGLHVKLTRPEDVDRRLPESLEVNVVRVWEDDPPEGEEPVEWIVVTTEPIDTAEDLEYVVDIYRSRWLIEELNKAIKTGCSYERRQFESLETLQKALGLLVPVAWSLLVLRHLSRQAPDLPAERMLTPTQVTILKVKGHLRSDQPAIRDALLAVAALGGHLKRNGEPGWQVLGRGYTDLLLLEQGWLAALTTLDEGAVVEVKGRRPPTKLRANGAKKM